MAPRLLRFLSVAALGGAIGVGYAFLSRALGST
jgi:hypothetical protein